MLMGNILERNSYLKDTCKGKRCFIIGNGPSLNTQNIKLLKDEITIVVSSFFRHPDAKIIHPKYWILADPLIWTKPEIHFFPSFSNFLEKEITTKLFVPENGYDFFSKLTPTPFLDLHYYQYDGEIGIDSIIDFTKGIPPFGQNVIMAGLMLAFYMGCNPIYFIGCDHESYLFTKEEFENKTPPHFYESPNNYKDSDTNTWEHWRYCVDVMNSQYEQLKLYAKLNDFFVYNATNGGYFNCFPRIDYKFLFKGVV